MRNATIQCDGRPAEDFAEAYVQNALPEPGRCEFEEHFFDCDVCFARLQIEQAMRQVLAAEPEAPATQIGAKVLGWPKRWEFAGAIAAMLLIGAAGLLARAHLRSASATSNTLETSGAPPAPIMPPATAPQPAPHSAPSTAATVGRSGTTEIADLKLPEFHGSVLRGGPQNADFEDGMKAYQAGDCKSALKQLAQVPQSSAQSKAAEFYAGVCRMQAGDFAAAESSLEPVAEDRDSVQQEAASYYLAQIALARNDAASARRELARTIELRGDFQIRAENELREINLANRVD